MADDSTVMWRNDRKGSCTSRHGGTVGNEHHPYRSLNSLGLTSVPARSIITRNLEATVPDAHSADDCYIEEN